MYAAVNSAHAPEDPCGSHRSLGRSPVSRHEAGLAGKRARDACRPLRRDGTHSRDLGTARSPATAVERREQGGGWPRCPSRAGWPTAARCRADAGISADRHHEVDAGLERSRQPSSSARAVGTTGDMATARADVSCSTMGAQIPTLDSASARCGTFTRQFGRRLTWSPAARDATALLTRSARPSVVRLRLAPCVWRAASLLPASPPLNSGEAGNPALGYA